MQKRCRPLKRTLLLPWLPGTYVPGYLDSAAARLEEPFVPPAVLSAEFHNSLFMGGLQRSTAKP